MKGVWTGISGYQNSQPKAGDHAGQSESIVLQHFSADIAPYDMERNDEQGGDDEGRLHFCPEFIR